MRASRVWGYSNYNGSCDLFCGTQKAFAAAMGCSVNGLRPKMFETGNDNELRLARAHPNVVVHIPTNWLGHEDITRAHVHETANRRTCETCEQIRIENGRERRERWPSAFIPGQGLG